MNLTIVSCHVLWRELCHYASISENSFQFRFLPQGLHNEPEVLRRDLQRQIDEVSSFASGDGLRPPCDAILVGYGLCCRGIEGIVARTIPLVFMRGHDCITFLLGSKDRYREYFDNHPGTYWYSPGWIDTGTQPGKDRYEWMLRQYTERYGEENAPYLMESTETWMHSYGRAAYVDQGFFDSDTYKEYTRNCAEWLGWNCEILEGSPQLIIDLLAGNWDPERFLVVQPGERVVCTHDESIVDTAPAE